MGHKKMRHIRQTRGAVKTMCNTPPPPSKTTFPLFTACLHLFDSGKRLWCLRLQASKHNFGVQPLVTLTFDLQTPEVDRSCHCPGGRFVPIYIEIYSFVFEVYNVHKLVTDGRTDRRTDGRTDRALCLRPV